MPQSLSASDKIALLSLAISFASLVVALIALWTSYLAIIRGNKNGSAASLISLNEAFREAWERFLAAKDEESRKHQFAELINLLEIACALEFDKALVGNARELLTEYLLDVFRILNNNSLAKQLISELISGPTTMKYMRRFLTHYREISR